MKTSLLPFTDDRIFSNVSSCWKPMRTFLNALRFMFLRLTNTFGLKAALGDSATVTRETIKRCLSKYPLFYQYPQRDGWEVQMNLSALDQQRTLLRTHCATFSRESQIYYTVMFLIVLLLSRELGDWLQSPEGTYAPGHWASAHVRSVYTTLYTNRSLLPFKGNARGDVCSCSPNHGEWGTNMF